MPEREPVLIGGRYRVLEKLGEGGMGTVYAARDERLQRDVAIKRLHVFGGSESQVENFRKRFQREAIGMAQFIHPYIVPVYDYGDEDGWIYLVMGYMSGGSLRDRMHGPLPVKEAVQLLIPIASALGYVHENGVIHRDVKPQNILFNQRGIPMLSDFGILKLMESDGVTLTATGTGIGTPAYMAPEQITSNIDHHVDQYSLGVVFYELVTGKKPFEGDTPVMTLIMHRTDPLPDPHQFVPTLSEETCKVLKRSLAKKPKDRYENMEAFESALRALLVEDEQKAAPPVEDIEPIIEEFIEQVEEKIEERQAEEPALAAENLAEDETLLAQEPLEAQPVFEEEPTALMAQETRLSQDNFAEDATQINAEIELPEESPVIEGEELTQITGFESAKEESEERSAVEDLVNPEDETQISGFEQGEPGESPSLKSKKKFPLWIPIAGGVVLVTLIVLFATGVFAGLFAPPTPTKVPQVAVERTRVPTEEPPPAVEEEPPQEEEWTPERGSLSFKGGWHLIPIIERVTEEFKNEHPGWEFTIEAMSSDEGIERVSVDDTDFGLSSRELSSNEMIEYGDLEFFQIAWNPVVVFVNPELDIDNLTIEDIYRIFFGHVNNWAELDGPDLEIVRVMPNEQNISYWNFHACLLIEDEFVTDRAIFHEEEELVAREVAEIPGAIGFSSVFHNFEGVRLLSIEGVQLSDDAIQEGFWPLETPMFLITNGEPSPQEGYFLEYIFSPRGKELIMETQFSPIR